MKLRLIAATILSMSLALPSAPVSAATVSTSTLIKSPSNSAVYWYASDAKRYVFPTEGTFYSWFPDFSGVQTISDSELAAITIGGNVTYRPGAKMLKITTDPRTYAVSKGGYLRLIGSESVAISLYGSNWATKVHDLPDPFFVNYKLGNTVYNASDINISNEYNGVTNPNDTLFSSGTPNTPTTGNTSVTLATSRNFINEGESVALTGRLWNAPSYGYRLELIDFRNGSIVRTCDNATSCDTTVYPYRLATTQNTLQYFIALKRTSDNYEVMREYSPVIYFNGSANGGVFSSGSSSLASNKTSINNGDSIILTGTVSNVTVADSALRMEFYRERDNALLYTCYDARTCNYTFQVNTISGSNSERYYLIVKNDNNEQIPAAYSSRISIANVNNGSTGVTSSATSYTNGQQMTLTASFSDQTTNGYIQFVDLRNNAVVYTCSNTNYCSYTHYAPTRINNETTVRYSARYYAYNDSYYRASKESADLYLPGTSTGNYSLNATTNKTSIASGDTVNFTAQLVNAPSSNYRIEIYDQNNSLRTTCTNTAYCYLVEAVNKSGSQSSAQYTAYAKDNNGTTLSSTTFPSISFTTVSNPVTTLTGTANLTVSPAGTRPAGSTVTISANVTNYNVAANALTIYIWAGTTPSVIQTCTNTATCTATYSVGAAGASIPVYTSVVANNASNALTSATTWIYTN